jgi:hypothetical protein
VSVVQFEEKEIREPGRYSVRLVYTGKVSDVKGFSKQDWPWVGRVLSNAVEFEVRKAK